MDALEDAFFQQLVHVCSETRQSFDLYTGMSQPRRQLLTLILQKGEISHATLQQQLAIDGATITRLVKQFESEGVLIRRLDPQDNRYTLVSLTTSGQQLAAGLEVTHRRFQKQLLEGTTREELESMIRVLERIRINIQTIQEVKREKK